MREQIEPDEGFFYGLGVFETIALVEGLPVLFGEHIQRLKAGMEQLGIARGALFEKELRRLETSFDQRVLAPYDSLKIAVSANNVLVSFGNRRYEAQDYAVGFRLCLSAVRRNETSPLTYLKTLNYADNILEKRRAQAAHFDEPVFCNTQGYLAEGATTNLFFVREGQFYTPPIASGLLPGVMRAWVLERFPVQETTIAWSARANFDEMFVTNSLLGIMPVRSLEDRVFSLDVADYTRKVVKAYREYLQKHHQPFALE
jgi:4-amino-4-deoxychorismate lyase